MQTINRDFFRVFLMLVGLVVIGVVVGVVLTSLAPQPNTFPIAQTTVPNDPQVSTNNAANPTVELVKPSLAGATLISIVPET